jgi:hypothetical protein
MMKEVPSLPWLEEEVLGVVNKLKPLTLVAKELDESINWHEEIIS